MVKPTASRKCKRCKKSKPRRCATHRRRRGGGGKLMGAPTDYSLAGDWSSQMSLGQGGDYFKYHEGQHGGSAPYPVALSGTPLVSADMNGSAMTSGTYKALQDVAGLSDLPNNTVATSTGGRRKGIRRTLRRSLRRKGKRSLKRRHRGGSALGYAPVGAPGMLLASKHAYDQAGLNPEYRGSAVEYDVAKARDQV